MKPTNDDLEFLMVRGFNVSEILKNQKIIEQLEYRKKHPQAFNYAQFEVWVTDILNGGNGFPLPKIPGESD